MDEHRAIWFGALAGAVAGGAFGYLYFTERGRELREDLEPRVNNLMAELRRAWEAAEQARSAVDETWTAAVQPPRPAR